MIGLFRESVEGRGKMKVAGLVLLCLMLLVHELSAAPLKDKKHEEAKQKAKDTTDKKDKKQFIPGIVTTSDSPSYTGYAAPFINYDPYNMGVGTQEDLGNRPVELVQINSLNITNGVIRTSDIAEG